jgi:hypothetical protein
MKVWACCDYGGEIGWLYIRADTRARARRQYEAEVLGTSYPPLWLSVRALRKPEYDGLPQRDLDARLNVDFADEWMGDA